MTPDQLAAVLSQNPAPVLLDVRSGAEFRQVHVTGARNLPLDQLNEAAVTAHAAKDAPILLICQSGARSEKARVKLAELGFTQAVSIVGGTEACVTAGLPVERGEGVISLESQVRIGAGAMVFVATLLGAFVNPLWLVLSAFVGAGLVFAGATNFCGMGLLLAKAPWNR